MLADGPGGTRASKRNHAGLQLPTVRVVLPAYNEAAALGPLLSELRTVVDGEPFHCETIVVDDGSQDDTARIASQASFHMPLDVVAHSINQGLAAALRTGLSAALAAADPEDVIITLDADNTHPPTIIPQLLRRINEGYDVVIASRYQPGAVVRGVPTSRRLLSDLARYVFQWLLPVRGARDYTCGYRAYRASALYRAFDRYGEKFIAERGFSCMAEVLLKLHELGCTISEVPLHLHYDRRGAGSKMQVLRTVRETLTLVVRYRIRKP